MGNKKLTQFTRIVFIFDPRSNESNDEQLLKDMANGKVVISYNEYKTEGDPKKPKRHVVRK
jgi:hypothetical protein